jgi:hypothetical protein
VTATVEEIGFPGETKVLYASLISVVRSRQAGGAPCIPALSKKMKCGKLGSDMKRHGGAG